jgi:hypothetical protein
VSFPTAALLRNFKHFRKGWQEKRFSVSTLLFDPRNRKNIRETGRPAGLLVRATFCYKNVVFKTDLIGRDLSPPKYDSQARSRPCESTYAQMHEYIYK